MTNPFQSLIYSTKGPAYWPEERRTVRVLEVEEDREPVSIVKTGPKPGAIYTGRAARLEGIKEVIRSAPGIVTATHLGNLFGVRYDRIHKDMRVLKAQGFDVLTDSGRGYEYAGERDVSQPAPVRAERGFTQAIVDLIAAHGPQTVESITPLLAAANLAASRRQVKDAVANAKYRGKIVPLSRAARRGKAAGIVTYGLSKEVA